MGGLYCVQIPESMYPEIKRSLDACNVSVAEMPVPDEDRNQGCLSIYRCTDASRATVTVVIGREPPAAGTWALLQPVCRHFFRGTRATNHLVDRIRAQLTQDAAMFAGR